MLPLLAILGLVALAASSRARASAPSTPRPSGPTSKDIAAKIVQETQEIIDGKREAYSDDDEAAAELERARRAVQLAQQKEAQTPASSSSSSPRPSTPAKPAPKPASMSVGPVVQRQAAAPPAAAAPAGTDLAVAKKTAPDVAAHLKSKNRNTYSRDVVKLWQKRAGIASDGIYGRGTEAALKYFGAKPPKAFFAQGNASYTPPRA